MISLEDLELNDGHWMSTLSFTTDGLLGGPDTTDQVDRALSAGYSHIDTTPSYGNETAVGIALRESGLSREDVYITTKYTRSNGLSVDASMRNSLRNLGVKYVDMYILDKEHYDQHEIPTLWRQMETLRERGLTRSIGVRNFTMFDLHILLRHARIKPAANQIPLNPYNLSQQGLLIEYAAKHNIFVQTYDLFTTTTRYHGGPLDQPLRRIAYERAVTVEHVLVAWAHKKGVGIVLTPGASQQHFQSCIPVRDIDLCLEDVASLDLAGSYGPGIYVLRTLTNQIVSIAAASLPTPWVCDILGKYSQSPSDSHRRLGEENSCFITP